MTDEPAQPTQDNLNSEANTESTPTWEGEIKDYFTQMDIGCMRKHHIDLTSYEQVSNEGTARNILTRVSGTSGGQRMPLHARPWSDGKVARFGMWVENGRPRTAADLVRSDTDEPTKGAST